MCSNNYYYRDITTPIHKNCVKIEIIKKEKSIFFLLEHLVFLRHVG